MLIIDGFGSHMTISFNNMATEAKIVLFRLPPHSTHMTQPLDVGVFQPFKHYHTEAIDEAVRLGDTKFGTVEFLAAFQSFRDKTFRPITIRHAFRATGLVPYNSEVVLEKVRANIVTPRSKTSPSTLNPESLLNRTPKDITELIQQDAHLRHGLKEHGNMHWVSGDRVGRFIKGAMVGAYD